MDDSTILLNNGQRMPLIGLGCFFGDKPDNDEVAEAVKTAIDIGYRLFDVAAVYNTEPGVGRGIKAKIDEGVVKREDLFVTSKLPVSDQRPQHVKPALRKSLEDLGLDYLDLYLIHVPFAVKKPKGETSAFMSKGLLDIDNGNDHVETWKVLEECVDECLVKSIGFSNFNSQQTQRIVDNARIKPVNNQIEVHPYLSQVPLVDYCQQRGVSITAYTPLGQAHSSWAKDGFVSPLLDPVIKDIAKKHNRNAGQVALRYHTQRNICVIAKSSNPARLRSNFEIFNFTLDEDDMKALAALNKDDRINNFFPAKEHKDWPFNIPF